MKKIKKISLIFMIFLFAAACNFLPFGGGGGGSGLLRSRDAGDSWELKNQLTDGSQYSGVSATRVRLDSNDRKRVYFGSSTSGIYFSADDGDLWQRVLSGSRVYDLQINPADGQDVYAGGTTGDAAKLFKTRDGGQTWTVTFSQSSATAFVSAIALAPRDSKTVIIGLSTGEVLKSSNAGTTWDLLKPLSGRILKILVSTSNPDGIYALSRQSGLYRSSDGGASWAQLPAPAVAGAFLGSGQTFEDFALADGESTIYVAGSSGLFRTKNLGNNWEKLGLPLHDANTAVTALALNPKNSSQIFTAVGQTFYKSTDSGASWQTVALPITGVVRDLAVDPQETNVIYIASGQPITQ